MRKITLNLIPNRRAGGDLDMDVARVVMGQENGESQCYSTDVAAAWRVVERMQQRGHTMEMADRCPRMHYSAWDVTFYGPERDGWAQASTAPLAICRAALAALAPAPGEGDDGK